MPTPAGNRRDALRDAITAELIARGHQHLADRIYVLDGYQLIEVRLHSRDQGYVSTSAPAWDVIRSVLDDIEGDVMYGPQRAAVRK